MEGVNDTVSERRAEVGRFPYAVELCPFEKKQNKKIIMTSSLIETVHEILLQSIRPKIQHFHKVSSKFDS